MSDQRQLVPLPDLCAQAQLTWRAGYDALLTGQFGEVVRRGSRLFATREGLDKYLGRRSPQTLMAGGAR